VPLTGPPRPEPLVPEGAADGSVEPPHPTAASPSATHRPIVVRAGKLVGQRRVAGLRTRAAAVVILGALIGCAGADGQALIPVDIAAGTVSGVKTVDVTVSETGLMGREVRRQRFDWTASAGAPLQVGLYLPDGFSGEVAVQARAFNGAAAAIGVSNRVILTAKSGRRATLAQLLLAPDAPAPDAGTDGRVDGGATDGPRSDAPPDAPPDTTPGDGPAPDGPGNADGPAPGRSWTPGENIEQDMLAASYTPDVAIDGMGNVIVAWREGASVKLRRHQGSTRTWGNIQTIDDRGPVDAVQVAMSSAGRALVVWFMATAEVDPSLQGLWARHSSDSGATWSDPIPVHAGPVYHDLALAMAPTGAARLAWQESASNINSLWSAHFNPQDGSFAGVAMVKLGSDPDDRYPRVAIAGNGDGLLAWVQDDDMGQDSIWAADFSGNTVGTPELLDNYTSDSAGEVDVAIAADGSRALAVWQQRNATTSADLFYNEWTSGSGSAGWRGPLRVLNADWVSAPAVVVDSTGASATVAFTQPLTGNRWSVVQTRWTTSGGWGSALPLETTNRASGTTDEDPIPHLGIDAEGNIHAIWRRKISATAETAVVVVRRYTAATMTWQPDEILGEITDLRAYHPEISVAEEGRAAASFYYLDPTNTANPAAFNVHASFFR
jgi:hypothetical protein